MRLQPYPLVEPSCKTGSPLLVAKCVAHHILSAVPNPKPDESAEASWLTGEIWQQQTSHLAQQPDFTLTQQRQRAKYLDTLLTGEVIL